MAKTITPHLLQLDLSSRHTELCDIRFKHDYFKDTFFGAAEFIPDEETVFNMKRMHILYRVDKRGITLGYRLGEGSSNLQRLKKSLRLTFWIRSNDQAFLNYTDIPYEFTSQLYYFNNKIEDKEQTGVKNLSKSSKVSAEDRIAIGGSVMKFQYAFPMFDANVVVKDEFGDIAFEVQQDGLHEYVNLNLHGEFSGRFFLYIDNELEHTFYLVPASVGKVLGVLDIFIDPKDESTYSVFENSSSLLRQQYVIHFKNREIKWRYLLVENSPVQIHFEHQILDARRGRNVESIEFENPKNIYLENGLKAIEVFTKHPIPLREIQEEKFKLRTKKGKAKVESLFDLPGASARSNFKTNFENKYEVFSELLVYL